MRIAVLITQCCQIGPDTWQDYHTTKVFEEHATIKEINDWIVTIDKTANLSSAKISLCVN